MEKDLKVFFERTGDANELFINEMRVHKTQYKLPLSIHWLQKYKSDFHSESFKKILFSYVETALLNPELITDNQKIIE